MRGYKKEWGAVGALVLLSFFLRLLWIDRVPPGVRYDELLDMQMAERVLEGDRPIYFAESWGHEPLFHYMQAAALALLGKTALGLRFTSMLCGTLSALTTYLIARQLFGPPTALLSTLFLATSFWSLMLSRFGLRIVGVTPWMGLAAYAFWRGLETSPGKRSRIVLWFSLCGLAQAAMLYTYFAGWMSLGWVSAFGLYLFLFHRPLLRGRWPAMLLCMAIPLLLVIPMLLYLYQHPEIGRRVGQVGSVITDALRSQDPTRLLRNAWETLGMFSHQADQEWLYNISGRPVFEPISAVFFYGGLLLALWHWRDPRHAFVLLWLVMGIAPTLAIWPAGSLPHSVIALSPAFILTGLAMATLWRWAWQGKHPWLKWSVGALVICATLVFASVSGYDYFIAWPNAQEVQNEYQAPIATIARYLQKSADSSPVSVSAPLVDFWNPWNEKSFRLLFQRQDLVVRWFNGSSALLFPAGEQVRFVLPAHLGHPSRLDTELDALLMKSVEPIETGQRDVHNPAFDLYRLNSRVPLDEFLASCASAPVWSSPETIYATGESERQRQPLSFPLELGNRLSFLGYVYSQDQVSRGETWRLTTCWRVLDTNPDPLAIFIHILDNANQVKASRDELSVSTTSWQMGDVFVHIHLLSIPSDMPFGVQRVELGVYSPTTLERLRLDNGNGEQTIPYNRVLLRPLSIQ